MSNSMECSNNEEQEQIIVENPTQEQIRECLKARNHRTRSIMTLYSCHKQIDSPQYPGDYLSVRCCTRDRYSLEHYSIQKGQSRELVDMHVNPKERPVRYISDNGEMFSVPFKKTVSFDTALRVALYFAETDNFPDDVTWDRKFK